MLYTVTYFYFQIKFKVKSTRYITLRRKPYQKIRNCACHRCHLMEDL